MVCFSLVQNWCIIRHDHDDAGCWLINQGCRSLIGVYGFMVVKKQDYCCRLLLMITIWYCRVLVWCSRFVAHCITSWWGISICSLIAWPLCACSDLVSKMCPIWLMFHMICMMMVSFYGLVQACFGMIMHRHVLWFYNMVVLKFPWPATGLIFSWLLDD